jgi:acetoin utilization deacetylase AcuC-like enzyme
MLKIGYSPLYNHFIEGGHRFPMLKYDLIPEQLLYEGTITEENLFCPQKADNELLLATHSEEYLQKLQEQSLFKSEIRKMGFPLSEKLVLREATIMQGTTDAALFALKYGISLNVAGGTHHAFYAHGEGFCLMNDFCIAANYLLMTKLANKILIIDLDVHQGNGTASLMQNEERVFTFSMHCGANYPLHK